MVNVSVVIPVYNEIRFIQRTLESVIGEADEIIISDNASTDGTSDICQSFASKYPEIKYTRQKENIGTIKNFLFCCNQISGKYTRNMGAHDMLSTGSNQSMSLLLDRHSDAVMVYPKYVIGLIDDYSFYYFHSFEEFGNDLLSELSSVRARSMITNLREFSIIYGLWRTEVFRDVISHRIFQQFCTDHTTLSMTATKGKMLADEKSIFFRMNPHGKNESLETQKKRWKSQLIASQKNINLSFWNFLIIAEQYDLLLETFGESDNLTRELFDFLVRRFCGTFADSEFTLEGMPSIVPGKEDFCLKVMTAIREYKKALDKEEKEVKNKIKRRMIIKGIKKTIKCILPYGFTVLYRHIKSTVLLPVSR